MKRRLFKLALFLILGAIVNVAVAWGCAWKMDVNHGPGTDKSIFTTGVVEETPNQVWRVFRNMRPGAMRVFSYHFARPIDAIYGGDPVSLLPTWNQDFFSGIHREELNEYFQMQDGRGWPMLALWGQAFAESNMSSPPYCEVEYAILLTDFIDPTQVYFGYLDLFGPSRSGAILWQVRFLPLHPIWHGFAINTVFYAVVLWALTLGPLIARRMIRRKNGLLDNRLESMANSPLQFDRYCRSCRHSLRGFSSRKCPECGREFDPADPRTTLPHTTRKFWFALEVIGRFLIISTGILVVFSFMISVVGIPPYLLWFIALLASPFILFILLVILLPWVPISRRFRIMGVILPALFISIAWTQWPLSIPFSFHRSTMNKLADQVIAGQSVATPQEVGMFRFHTVRQIENGNVGFQITGGPGGGIFLVRVAPGSQRVWYNTNWETNLGGGWYHVYED